MQVRPYQAAALGAVEDAFRTHSSALVVMATGLGKTVLFAHDAARVRERVMVIAHRDELVRQAAEKLGVVSGEPVGIEMGQESVDEQAWSRPRLIVSSVQTLCRPKRQRKFNPREFGRLIIDEAHHSTAQTYRDVIAYFCGGNATCKLLGVTATPKRGDDVPLGDVYETVAYDYGIEPAIEDGWLVPVRQQAVQVDGLDFSKCRTLAGDFSASELEQILEQEQILHAVATPTIELAGDRRTLLFAASVSHAHKLAEILNRHRDKSAVALDGATDPEERRRQVDRFRRGEYQFLANCGLFLEGFDVPATSMVVMARPTKSLSLYCQVIGRGTRPLPGVVDGPETAELRRAAILASGKPDMLILDFVGNSGRHRIVNATDILGGKYDEETRAYARQTIEEEGDSPLVPDSLERARDERELLGEIWARREAAQRAAEEALRQKREEAERLRAITARASYATEDVCPFAGGDGHSPGVVASARDGVELATPKQVNYLVYRAGWSRPDAERLSKRQASAIIGKHKDREGAA